MRVRSSQEIEDVCKLVVIVSVHMPYRVCWVLDMFTASQKMRRKKKKVRFL